MVKKIFRLCTVKLLTAKMLFKAIVLSVIGPLLLGAEYFIDFDKDPSKSGWQALREAQLWFWNRDSGQLEVIWDSSQANNAFYIPLPYQLTRSDTFGLELEMVIDEIYAGLSPDKPFTFEIAVGFFNIQDLSSLSFRRGVVGYARNILEWDFFPDTGFGPTIWPTAISETGLFNYNGTSDYLIEDLPVGKPIRVRLEFEGEIGAINSTVLYNGGEVIRYIRVPLADAFTDFRLNAAGIINYCDAGTDGSVFARAKVKWVRLWWPDPPLVHLGISLGGGKCRVIFDAKAGWRYVLQESLDLLRWDTVHELERPDTDRRVEVEVENQYFPGRFYRLFIYRP